MSDDHEGRRTTAVAAAGEAEAPATSATPSSGGKPGAARRDLTARLLAEALGTFTLVLVGCGSAVLSSSFVTDRGQQVGIGFVGIALAFGIAVLAMAAAVGGVSGGHFNPAVTVGLAIAGRMRAGLVVPYVVTQVVAATVAGAVLLLIASGRPGFDPAAGFASNGYGSRSPGGFSLGAAFLAEVVLTALFLGVIIATTGERARPTLAPIAIGLTLTVIHLVAIPIDNTSVNPARSLGVAWFAGPDALGQVWLFIVAPVIGAALAGGIFRGLTGAHLNPGVTGEREGA